MVTKCTFIKNESGLHARPASEFVQSASKFSSVIKVSRLSEKEKETANAKSIMDVLLLGLCKGEHVEVQADGEDEEVAVSTLISLIDSGFGE